jgi:hypothetical protein
VIRDTDILQEFPGKTEGDLYLWVLDHQHYLAEIEGRPLQSPAEAARTFFEKKGRKPLRSKQKTKPEKK